MKKDILSKIKNAGLVGRGGASYPVWQKWQAVHDAPVNKLRSITNEKVGKFVICNCSEGEPGVHKDGHIVMHHADRVIDGMKLAIEYLGAKQGIFYLNGSYYKNFKKLLELQVKKSGAPIVLFEKPHMAGYVGGEETTALNVIEGKRAEPRSRPPFPTACGLWGQPTLVNNVETFYDVSLVERGDYKNERFFGVTGDCMFEGIYNLSTDLTIEQILKKTNNYPKFDFFVQVGGDAAGEILNAKQLKNQITDSGSIRVYSLIKHKPQQLIHSWITFFKNESCGQCTPCREGTYRLADILAEAKPNWQAVRAILDNLADTALCGLGMAVPIPVRSYVKNVIADTSEKDLRLTSEEKKLILEAFI